MKIKSILLCALLLTGTTNVFAADDDDTAALRAECVQMGTDEGLSGDDLQAFVDKCMQDQGE